MESLRRPPQPEGGEEERLSLRPGTLDSFIGQDSLKDKLRIFVSASRQREEPLDHTLFYGPPGLGKTTLASIIAREMGGQLRVTTGPALERAGDHITNVAERVVYIYTGKTVKASAFRRPKER